MEEIRVDCPAKINLFLEVLGKRDDGYHEVTTVMQTVGLYDRLFFRAKESGIDIYCSDSSVPTDERNLIFKVAKLLLDETGVNCGVRVEVEKKIPVASGLGGGSSDAAGTFIALNRLWSLGLTKDNLLNLSRKVGTDIAFFINLANDDFSAFSGGTLLGKGKGNELAGIPSFPSSWLILVAPSFAVSTKWAYESLHLELTGSKKDPKMIIDAFQSGDLSTISKFLFNRFEEVVVPKYPVIGGIKRELLQEGAAGALMSGSGPVVFGLFPDGEKAEKLAKKISGGRKEERVYVTRTY
jgi:4-diphosphocytidyl-2-C-methyl-D-erythritol kinase